MRNNKNYKKQQKEPKLSPELICLYMSLLSFVLVATIEANLILRS